MKQYTNNSIKKPINPIKIGVISFIIFAIIVIIATILFILFKPNPYGPQTKIDNFSTYYKNIPEDTKNSIFNSLYLIIQSNTDDNNKIPKSGAAIRENTAKSNYNESTNVHSDSFIVDIPELKQSYRAQVNWSNDAKNDNISGYPVLFLCPTEAERTYDTPCTDMTSDYGVLNDPAFNVLPIYISYYSSNSAEYTNYNITAHTNNDNSSIVIVITDNTGGNYEAALQKLRDNNIDLTKYTIEYVDNYTDQGFGYAGDD